MKGGKQGRKRRTSGGSAGRKGGARDSANKGGAKRQWSVAPKRGGRVKPRFGGLRTSGEE